MKYDHIRKLREDSDLTQSYFANYLHVSQRAYSRYENGERSIPIELLAKIADFHGTSVDYLINRTNIKKPYP